MSGYKLKFEDLPVVLDPDTYCPMKVLNIKLNVLYESQIDGRMWGNEEVDKRTQELIEDIMSQVKEEISSFVVKTDPYGGWRGDAKPIYKIT